MQSKQLAAPKKKRWPWVVAGSAVAAAIGGASVALLLVVGLVILVGLVVIAGGLYVVAILLFSPIYYGTDFAEALAADNDQIAYDLLCPATQESLPFDEFVDSIAPAQPVTKTEIVKNELGFFLAIAPPTEYEVTYHFDDGTSGSATYVASDDGYGKAYVCEVSAIS